MTSSRGLHEQLSLGPQAARDRGIRLDDFLCRAFRTADNLRHGEVTECELQIGNCSVSIARVSTDGGVDLLLGSLAVPDSEAIVRRAIEGGATELFATEEDAFDTRERRIRDPYGTLWLVVALPHALAPFELRERIEARGALQD